MLPDQYALVTITKLVEGGQGLGEAPDGKKVFVWNALPGETVRVRLIKQKHSFAEGVADEIVTLSPERIAPLEDNYLATSPWQIMAFEAENKYKKQIVADIFTQAKVAIPEFGITAVAEVVSVPGSEAEFTVAGMQAESPLGNDAKRGSGKPPGVFHYRNKMEYSFWGDEAGLHLALHQRSSHGKQIVQGSALAMPGIDKGANALCAQLNGLQTRAGDLKTIIVRASQNGDVVASLFVKRETFPKLQLPDGLKGLRIYYSNPKSPASVRTRLLQEVGDVLLTDTLLGKQFIYDVDSFFQVNVPMFEQALQRIKERSAVPELVDMYAGVGSIGLSVAGKTVDLVELDPATVKMAGQNAASSELEVTVIETPAEKALDYITGEKAVIFDPPRAGLHDKVVARVLGVLPPQITYLSCNPVTQARDLARLQDAYDITYFEAFNFFPRTPHIETLAVLTRKH